MEASPTAAFDVPEAKFALQFLVIALDPPAPFGGVDENVDCTPAT
jgi:hypothetical protein